MRISSAVLRSSGVARPYTSTLPLTIEELQLDDPGPGELMIRIESAGVCHSDLSVLTGRRPRPLPMALGHEAAGVVTAIGSGIDDVGVGAHVVLVFVPSCGRCEYCRTERPALCPVGGAANGRGELIGGGRRLSDAAGPIQHHLGVSAFAQYAVVDRSSAVVIDDDVPFDVAAILGCAMLTGFGAVQNTAGVAAGESVTVIGLGGVGQASILGAVAAGASPVVAVDPVRHKRDLAIQPRSHPCLHAGRRRRPAGRTHRRRYPLGLRGGRVGAGDGTGLRTHRTWRDDCLGGTAGTRCGALAARAGLRRRGEDLHRFLHGVGSAAA